MIAALRREVVLEVDVVARRVLELLRPDVADVLERPRRDDVGRGDAADLDPKRLREEVGAEDRGQDDDQADGGDGQAHAIAAAERRVGRAVGVSTGDQSSRRVDGSVAAGVVGGEVGLAPGPCATSAAHDLAVGAAARLRGEPAHDLAEVARGRRAGRGDALVDERA